MSGSHESLARCATGNVEENLELVHDLRDSFYELGKCGSLAIAFYGALVTVVASSATGRGGPSQLAYRGHGEFATPNNVMAIRVTTSDGRPLDFDPLDPASYVTGLDVHAAAGVRAGNGWALVGQAAGVIDGQIRFGPGFELLGLAAEDVIADPTRIGDAITSHLAVDNRIEVVNPGDTNVHYVIGGSQPLSEVLGRHELPMKLVNIVATRSRTGQHVRLTQWSLTFSGSHSTAMLDGRVGVDVEGGAFPYHAEFSYRRGMDPDIELSCH